MSCLQAHMSAREPLPWPLRRWRAENESHCQRHDAPKSGDHNRCRSCADGLKYFDSSNRRYYDLRSLADFCLINKSFEASGFVSNSRLAEIARFGDCCRKSKACAAASGRQGRFTEISRRQSNARRHMTRPSIFHILDVLKSSHFAL